MKHKVRVTVLDKKLYPELRREYCADPAAEPGVNGAFQPVYHIPRPGNRLDPLLISRLFPVKRHEKHDPVAHNRPGDTVKVILYRLL